MTRGDRKIVPPRAAERWWMQLPRYRLLLVSETVPRVRIPLAPPYSLKCRESAWIALEFAGNERNSATIEVTPQHGRVAWQRFATLVVEATARQTAKV